MNNKQSTSCFKDKKVVVEEETFHINKSNILCLKVVKENNLVVLFGILKAKSLSNYNSLVFYEFKVCLNDIVCDLTEITGKKQIKTKTFGHIDSSTFNIVCIRTLQASKDSINKYSKDKSLVKAWKAEYPEYFARAHQISKGNAITWYDRYNRIMGTDLYNFIHKHKNSLLQEM